MKRCVRFLISPAIPREQKEKIKGFLRRCFSVYENPYTGELEVCE